MTELLQKAFEEAAKLPETEQDTLAKWLLVTLESERRLDELFDAPFDERVDALWKEEIESRVKAFDAGKITADSAEAVFKRINER